MSGAARKKTCAKCGRRLWACRDFYTRRSSACKECERQEKNRQYRETRKKPDGVFYDQSDGRCYEHRGYSKRIFWSSAMAERLRRLFPTTKNEDLAIDLGVSVRTLIRKARELGVEKSAEWMRAHSRENCKAMRILNKCRGNSGMFRKGQHASPATEFKPKGKTA